MSVFKLQQQFNLGLEEIAQKLGKAPSTVSNLTRLLQLPDAGREALRSGQISEGHARSILALKNQPTKQEELLRYILDNSWTVRQAEQFVVAAKKGASTTQAKGHTASQTALTKQLSKQLATDVKLRHTAKGGQLIIAFTTEEQLRHIAGKLQA